MDINYELYKVFYHVAKTLSFSESSKELFISQSAVSQSIKILEKKLNQTLFIRNTKKVQLTQEGEMLFKHIEPAINLIVRGENQIIETNSLNGGQLRIAASDTICRYFLVPYLKYFHEKYPKVHIKVTNATSIDCVELLESAKVDLIITNMPNIRLNSLAACEIKTIKTFRDVFIANKNFFQIKNECLTLAKLQNYPILMLDKNSTTSQFLHLIFQNNQLDLVPEIELSSNDLLIDLASIGLGIAFVPEFCLENKLSDLIIIDVKETLPTRKLAVAYKNNIPLSFASDFFINSLCEIDNKLQNI